MYELLRSKGLPLHAIVEIFEPAIERAPSSNRQGDVDLAGVTIAVKDMVALKGHRRGNGNPVDMQSAPFEERNARVIDQLLDAGVKIVATTSLLEYAAGAQHPDIPETRNPLDTRLTAGGSSAGSAALVGAGIIPLAVGTDTGGSIRIPAAYCGTIGFKPTSQLISLDRVTALAPTYDHLGFISQSLDLIEAALLATTMVPLKKPELSQRIRLGVPNYLVDDHRNDERITTRFREIEDRLRANGFELVDIDAGVLEKFRSAFIDVVLYEAWEIYGAQVQSDPGHFGDETRRLFLLGEAVTKEDYEEKIEIRRHALVELSEYMKGIDALIMPTVPYFAPETTPPIDSELGSYESLYTEIFNVSGQPAITLPARCEPLPMGIQLVGALQADLRLLEVARRVLPLLG